MNKILNKRKEYSKKYRVYEKQTINIFNMFILPTLFFYYGMGFLIPYVLSGVLVTGVITYIQYNSIYNNKVDIDYIVTNRLNIFMWHKIKNKFDINLFFVLAYIIVLPLAVFFGMYLIKILGFLIFDNIEMLTYRMNENYIFGMDELTIGYKYAIIITILIVLVNYYSNNVRGKSSDFVGENYVYVILGILTVLLYVAFKIATNSDYNKHLAYEIQDIYMITPAIVVNILSLGINMVYTANSIYVDDNKNDLIKINIKIFLEELLLLSLMFLVYILFMHIITNTQVDTLTTNNLRYEMSISSRTIYSAIEVLKYQSNIYVISYIMLLIIIYTYWLGIMKMLDFIMRYLKKIFDYDSGSFRIVIGIFIIFFGTTYLIVVDNIAESIIYFINSILTILVFFPILVIITAIKYENVNIKINKILFSSIKTFFVGIIAVTILASIVLLYVPYLV